MNILKHSIATLFLVGLSSLANASTIDLVGNLNIEGFNDSNKQTYSLHLSNLSGNAILDSAPITSSNGTLVLDALGTATTTTILVILD